MNSSENIAGPAGNPLAPGGGAPKRAIRLNSIRLLRWARAHAKTLAFLSAATTAIAAAGVAVGAIGALAAGVLVLGAARLLLVAIPVTGFTRDQAALVRKGQEFAESVEDVRVIMDTHAAAYDVIFRRLPAVGSFHPDLQALPRAEDIAGLGSRQASQPERSAAKLDSDQRPGPHRELKANRDRHRQPAPGGPGRRAGSPPAAHPRTQYRRSSTTAFWQHLTLSERQALSAIAHQMTFGAGSFICRQGERACHVIIIKSGRARVFTEHPDRIRVIAERGPGDLIGERAVMMLRWRSATVETLEDVQAIVISDEDFEKFLRTHPRVNALLEDQVYKRLTEDPGRSELALSAPSWTGQICPIILTDITAFGSQVRNDNDRLSLRRLMYDLLPEAFETSGIPWQDCYQEDRGDGTLIVVPPYVPANLIVEHALHRLGAALRAHNEQASNALRMQLRVAIHAGPVTRDAHGMTGNAINHTARLVQAKVLGRILRESQADLAVIASGYVYDNVIKQYDPQSPGTVEYQKVRFQSKESMLTAWLYLAGTQAHCALAGLLLLADPSTSQVSPTASPWARRWSALSVRANHSP